MPPSCCRKRLAILGLALSPARYFPWQQAPGPPTTDGHLFRPRFPPALLSSTIYSYTIFNPQPPPPLPLSPLCKSLAIQSIRSFTYRTDRPTDCNSYLSPLSITQSTTSSLCTNPILTNHHLRIHSVETLGTSLNRLALQLRLLRLVSAA